jgi:hypothetical protein
MTDTHRKEPRVTTPHDHPPHVIAVPADTSAAGADAGVIFGLYVGSALAAADEADSVNQTLSAIAESIIHSTVASAYTSRTGGLSLLVGTYLGRWCDLVTDYIPVCETPGHTHGNTSVARFRAEPADGEAVVELRSKREILDGWRDPQPDVIDRLMWFGRLVKAKTDGDHETYGRMMHDRLLPLLEPAQGSASAEVHTEAAQALMVFLHGVVTAAAMTFAELQSGGPGDDEHH